MNEKFKIDVPAKLSNFKRKSLKKSFFLEIERARKRGKLCYSQLELLLLTVELLCLQSV